MKGIPANFWRGRRVLVTGASGFIGAAVVRLLAQLGAEVHGTGHRRHSPAPAVHHRAVFPDEADAIVAEVLPESVIHLAAPVVPGATDEQRALLRRGVVDAAIAVATAANRHGIPVLHAGTCAEYGDAPAPHLETGPARPIDAYGALKLEATEAVLAIPRVTVARIFRAVGPGDTASVLAQAARSALRRERFAMTTGEQVREWNRVDAIAEGLVNAAALSDLEGMVVNVGGGPAASVLDAVQAVFEAAGADRGLIDAGGRPQRANEVPRLVGDHGRARSAWGAIPQPPLGQTMSEFVAWTAARREGAA